MQSVFIKPLCREDQAAARALILAGLEEHFGFLDLSLNPDLDDIASSYADRVFLCAWRDGELIGAGALIHEADGTGRIVRMSVARSHRRLGIGSLILRALLDQARARSYRKIVLETTETWDDAIGFYTHHGFRITHHTDGNAHFELVLDDQNSQSPFG